MRRKRISFWLLAAAITLWGVAGCSSIERSFLFYPTHLPHNNSLTPWIRDGETIGYARMVASPRNVWLMLHGNGGQASDRIYAMPCFAADDAVFILEYPGYGSRKDLPSKASFNGAAGEAYLFLRETYPGVPVCVVAESIGSGPASYLATLADKPDKLVLIVPFDRLSLVAAEHFPAFLVRLILKSDWDNVEALSHYPGPVEIIGAEADTIIPAGHARALAASVPGARLSIIGGGHNDWAVGGRVNIRNP